MPSDLQWIDWMPSPPLVPDDGPISLHQLRSMTLGDTELEREVLSMFAVQAARLFARLTTLPDDAAALAHTLKGSAQAIGASDVAEAAGLLEAAIRNGNPTRALAELGCAVAEARTAIEAMLGPS
jgi:HPt (histidine-containing phosphotransfer) domain-containing protein